jgi:hypothetical protein
MPQPPKKSSKSLNNDSQTKEILKTHFMKTLRILVVLMLLAVVGLQAQTPTNPPPTYIKGNMDIKYASRVNAGKVGIADTYTMQMNISNSAVFTGNIKHLPYIGGTFGVNQNSSLNYDISCDVVNPRPPHQAVNVGRIYGTVPIDAAGVYQFNNGKLVLGVVGRGNVQAFESKFSGSAAGKPLVKPSNWFDTMKRETLSLSRFVNGKAVTVAVKKYDKMTFQQHVMAMGPIPMYPESTVNGEMVYDYARYVWFFNNVNITYYVNGRQYADRLTGSIRWVEDKDRAKNGKGEYQFDVRFNEPPVSESAMFSAAADESAFFATDNTIASLTGVMRYQDSMQGETVAASKIEVDLMGNQLNKQQVMNVFKLVFFTCIVPFNAE